MKDLELINQIEAYLRGELSPEEASAFEQLRREDAAVDQQFIEHREWMQLLAAYGERQRLQHAMDLIHEQIDVATIKSNLTPLSVKVIQMWRTHKSNIAIAASVALVAIFSTLLFTGSFTGNNSTYSALRREINSIKRSQSNLVKNISGKSKLPANPGQFGGTGFALSANGYVATNYHVIKDADSLYIQNAAGDSYKVKVVYVEPEYDIAVLQIIDPDFETLGRLPYTFKKSNSDLGEDVFTIGFPRDEPVYGKGYLSSRTGFDGDTVAYQVSIPVNPGNSGGPLLDNRGNVIGIISGKQTRADGAAFAIKSNYLLKSLNQIPEKDLDRELSINKKNTIAGLNRKDQIKKIQDYIFMVRVY
ncbi:MAG: trypsin-like peptidase domain-containing protein [Sphingobacteriaceae bacterium]